MIRSFVVLALASSLAAAPALGAQEPAPRPRRPLLDGPRGDRQPGLQRRPLAGGPMRARGGMGMAGRGDAASMLLAQTGELRLTDQQVTRLAAIARRAGDRRRALRVRIDSLRAAAPIATAPTAGQPLRAELERMRDAARADLRDALAVLTPDQQAQAWEMRARREAMGAGPRRAPRGMRMRPGRPDVDRGFRPGPRRGPGEL